MSQNTGLKLTRRGALLGLTAAFTLGRASVAFGAAPGENRFIVILLRGALDGLSAVQPYGDPDCAAIRGKLALPQPGQDGGLLDLGGFYGLHPSLANLQTMYKAGDGLILHATAGAYRSRSHFEAQDYMESGADQRLSSGWLNRAVAAMPGSSSQELALTMGLSAPLILRGPARVEAWAPEHFGQEPPGDLMGRLQALYAPDPLLGPTLTEGLRRGGSGVAAATPDHKPQEIVLASTAGQMLAADGGPRVAVLEINGWDTHGGQLQRLKAQLAILDGVFAALHSGLGDSWRRTVIMAMTEFGRTARVNGTRGTDHGTAGVTFLVGGAVAGGRVRADWPGLAPGRLFEGRDLMPTTDVRAIAKGVLVSHMGLGAAALDPVFPGSAGATPLDGLVRA